MRKCIEPKVIWHVCPRHMVSDKQRALYCDGEKSLFLEGYSKNDIQNLIVQTIVFPTYQFTKYAVKYGNTLAYRIYKRLSVISISLCIFLNDNISCSYYRPQRSCGQGNVFTGVCLSTGGRVSASVHAGMPDPPGTRPPPRPGRPPRPGIPPGPGRAPPPDQADPPQKQTPAYGL